MINLNNRTVLKLHLSKDIFHLLQIINVDFKRGKVRTQLLDNGLQKEVEISQVFENFLTGLWSVAS
jgi:hypothetical protein